MNGQLPPGLTLFGGFKAIDSVVYRESVAYLVALNASVLARDKAVEERQGKGRGAKAGAASGAGALFGEGM